MMYDLKLFDYQQEVVDSKEEQIICNWARPLGKTYTLICKILKDRPNKVLWVGDFNNLRGKISEVVRMNESIKDRIRFLSSTQDMIIIKFYDSNSEINIYNYINHEERYTEGTADLLVFDDMLPYKVGDIKGKQAISMITINNYNKKLQKLFPYINIREQGVDTALKYGLIYKLFLDKFKEENINAYYDDMDILSMPENLKEDVKNDRLEELLLGYKVEPHNIFLIQTLAKLQSEYDAIIPSEDNLQRRETLIKIIISVNQQL